MATINVQKVTKSEDRTLPVFEQIDRMMQRIRERAFAVFAGRGFEPGNALQDWLTAERELCWPASELVEQDQNYVLNVALAGFEPKDITVTATPRELIVSAKAEATRGDKRQSKDERVCWSEFRSSDLYRRVELPADVQVAKVAAEYENGLLKIIAPKAQQPVTVVPVAAAA
jgi:HSP20 family molecular chaperone IbpA